MASGTVTRSGRHRTWQRTSRDLKGLIGYGLLLALGLLLSTQATSTVTGVEADVRRAVVALPEVIVLTVVVVAQVLALIFIVSVPIVLAWKRQWRGLIELAVAVVLASVATRQLEQRLTGVDPAVPQSSTETVLEASWPSSDFLASFTAAVLLLGMFVGRRWRRAMAVYLGLLIVLRAVTGSELPLDVVLLVAIGGTVGSAVLLLGGRLISMAGKQSVMDALWLSGAEIVSVRERETQSRDSRTFVAELAGGGSEFVKVIGRGQQEHDSLRRAYRRVRFREVGDDADLGSVRQLAMAESVLSLLAREDGVRTPELRSVAPIDEHEVLLRFERIIGTSLAKLPADAVSDELLADAWHQVARLHQAGVAHRDLNLHAWLVDEESKPWLVDFSFGVPAALPSTRSLDVAEFLAATYAVVGAQRAVSVAVANIGAQQVTDALSRLVPAALSKQTRDAVKDMPGKLQPLVDEVCEQLNVDKPQPARIERVKPRSLVLGALLGVTFYVVLPQLADLPRTIAALQEAELRWIPAVALGMLMVWVGMTLTLSGSAPIRVPPVPTALTTVAASFVQAIAPPGLGQMGLSVRYLQQRGVEPAAAVSATAAKQVAIAISHLALLAIFGVLAGRSGLLAQEFEKLPPVSVLALIVAGILIAVGVAIAIPATRTYLSESVMPAVRSSAASIRAVAANPVKVVQMFVGAVLLQLGFIAALYAASQAFDAQVTFTGIALIYLTVGTVAQVAPTPGGIGAVEAVLLAALTGIGVSGPDALAAVFLYRLGTFWIPIVPGALSMRWLTRHGYV